ncbi:MAG: phosphate ABC transporter substrate-binding protein PstS [Lysobacteraceae bacterium]
MVAVGLTAAVGSASAADSFTGAGSSFFLPIMSKWSSDYNKATGNKANYQSIGSGGGIAQIKAATVDFGASDAPLKPEDLKQFNLTQFPAVIGGVVPVVNIKGVAPGKIRFTGPLLADMFMGKVKTWNDPAIAAANPGMTLPATKITIVHRADGSGTTFNFVNYLAKVSPSWKSDVGEGTTVKWPLGIGGKGNEGVAAYVKQINGGLGYVELSYALQNKLTYAGMQNAAGNWVQPSSESFSAAAASADWAHAQDFYLVMTNAPGADSWPITASVFMIMQKSPKNPGNSKAALNFFRWAYANGAPQAKALDYVPLPAALVAQIQQSWAANLKL